MARVKLNHELVRKFMDVAGIRALDLSRDLGVSKQLGNYIIHHGGLKYAAALAKRFECREKDLVYTEAPTTRPEKIKLPPGMALVNGILVQKKIRRKRKGGKKVIPKKTKKNRRAK